MGSVQLRANISGLESANMNLRQIQDQYGPRRARGTLRVPMRNAMQLVSEEIASTTPVVTGRLAETTNLRTRVPNRFDKRRNPGVVYVATAGWEFPRASGFWQQALAVEFGTSQVRAQRILTTALATNSNRVIDLFVAGFRTQLDRASRRLANEQRRRALAGGR